MAPISLGKLCPNSPTTTTLSSLMECSVHESLHYTRDPHYEVSAVYFTLLSFCVGLTLTFLAILHFLSSFTTRFLLPRIATVLHFDPNSPSVTKFWFDDDMDSLPSSHEPNYGHEAATDSTDLGEEEANNHAGQPVAGICAYCFDGIYDEPITPCTKCRRVCCADCVRAIFILACRDESSMPPRCCRRPIQLAYGRLVLGNDEVQEFRDKYDEWITADRCYCPVPSCSVFLNPRVFPQLRRGQNQELVQNQLHAYVQGLEYDEQAVLGRDDLVSDAETLSDESGGNICLEGFVGHAGHAGHVSHAGNAGDAGGSGESGGSGGSGGSGNARPVIRCPKCSAPICLQCTHLAHEDNRECSRDDDISPELEEALAALRTKRCPKCRAAVRKSHGCNQMRCRCGAKWCWYCFRPVEVCEDEPCIIAAEGADLHGEMYSSDESNNDNYDDGGHHIMEQDYDTDDDNGAGDGGLEDIIAYRASYRPAIYRQDSSTHGIQNDLHLVTSNADRRTEEECRVVPFNCLHKWYPVEDFEAEASLTYDCERCWEQVYARLTDIPTSELPDVGLVPVQRVLVDDGDSKSDYDIMQDHIMFRCWICNQTICNKCRKGE